MTTDELAALLKAAGGVAAKAAEDWLADQAVHVTASLLAKIERAVSDLLTAGPGVTHAQRLVIEDGRTPPHDVEG